MILARSEHPKRALDVVDLTRPENFWDSRYHPGAVGAVEPGDARAVGVRPRSIQGAGMVLLEGTEQAHAGSGQSLDV